MSSASKSASSCSSDDDGGLRRGPWTVEEDTLLIHYISSHGEGRWNLLAKRSGLKRTGKSCRLRWLNYLKPDVKRGNLTPEEQFLILELHSKWGNRWSKIAQHLPGRTDNEIKNYWRTRVQKQARHLKIDPNGTQFQELVRCVWMPRLLQKIQGQSIFWDSSQYQNSVGTTNQLLCNSLAAAAAAPQFVVPNYAPPFTNEGETSNDLNNKQMHSTTTENCSSRSPSMSSSTSASESTNISKTHRISDQIPSQDMMDSHYYSQSQSGSYNVDNTSYDMETFSLGAFTVMGGSKDPAADIYSGDQNHWLADELVYGLWNLDELSQLRER